MSANPQQINPRLVMSQFLRGSTPGATAGLRGCSGPITVTAAALLDTIISVLACGPVPQTLAIKLIPGV